MRYLWLFLALFLTQFAIAQPEAEAKLAEQYFLDKDYISALELFDKLYKQQPNETYMGRILGCYDGLRKYEEAIAFMDKAIKKQPEQTLYPIIKASLMEKNGMIPEAEALYRQTFKKTFKTEGDFAQGGSYLFKAGKLDMALEAYQEGRKRLKADYVFADEMANIHAAQGENDLATQEFLNDYYANPETYSNSNLSILNLITPESFAKIEKVLLQNLELRPGDLGIRNTLYEFYVQLEDFEEAFLQVKGIDKFFKEDGSRVLKFAEIMRNSKNYELSNSAYDYLINEKKSSPYASQSYFEKATNGELKAFDQIPPDMEAIREAVKSYDDLIARFGKKPEYFNAIYRQAYLRVFYLFELEKPLIDLQELVTLKLGQEEWAKAKLLIGDILLMQKEYVQARATYQEISDVFKDRQLGAMSKFRLAQMAYYKGDFDLSASILSAIKDNTSNDISNDAIQLNLRIIDNTGLDSTTTALAIFANAQLLVYQRNYEPAMKILDSLAFAYPEHTLMDDIFWEKANIYLKQNNIPKALEFMDRILENFRKDIYADDALYTKARIYDYNLKDAQAAEKYYMELLTEFSGSLFSVEVRKRVRQLREKAKVN